MSKSVLVCLVLVVCCAMKNDAALTDAQKSQIQTQMLTIGLDCIKDHNLKFEHLRAFRERKVPEDEEAKCFVQCVFKNLGIMDDTGKLSEETAKQNARKVFGEEDENLPKVDDLIHTCMKVNDHEVSDGEKGCDRAKLGFKCFIKHAPKPMKKKADVLAGNVPYVITSAIEVGLDVDF